MVIKVYTYLYLYILYILVSCKLGFWELPNVAHYYSLLKADPPCSNRPGCMATSLAVLPKRTRILKTDYVGFMQQIESNVLLHHCQDIVPSVVYN